MYDWRSFLCYITNNYVIPEGQKEANVLGVAARDSSSVYYYFNSWSNRGFDLKKKTDKKH